MSNRTLYAIAAAIVVLLLLIGGWYLLSQANVDNDSTTPTPTPGLSITSTPISTPNGNDITTPDEDGEVSVKEFTLAASSFQFSPNELRVNQGDTVRITVQSQDSEHDFVLEDFDVRTELLSPGEEETVEFVADQAGTFEFYCTPHQAMGMTGTLVVE